MKRFALVVPQFPLPLPTPPGEDYLAEPARLMAESGFAVEILTRGQPQNRGGDVVNNVTVKRFQSTMAMTRAVVSGKYDLIHAHTDFQPAMFSGLFARGSKTVLTRHSYIVPRSAWKRKVLAVIMNRFDRVFALTAYERGMYCDMGVTESRIAVMPNQINVEFFSRGGDAVGFRRKWKIGERDPVVLFVANLRRVKNPDTILRALAEVRRIEKSARLVIGGKDLLVDEGGPNAQELAKRYGIGEATVLTGWLGPEPLRDALTAADVVVNSSFHEGLPLAICEAAAASKPLCLPKIGSLESFFGANALYHDPANHESLAGNILRYLRESNLREVHSKANRALIDQYDVPVARQRLLGAYRLLLES